MLRGVEDKIAQINDPRLGLPEARLRKRGAGARAAQNRDLDAISRERPIERARPGLALWRLILALALHPRLLHPHAYRTGADQHDAHRADLAPVGALPSPR